jgi:hypothetical protein
MNKSRNDDRTDRVVEWVATALPLLSLSHWTVRVSDDAAPDDAHADTAPHSQANTATIRLGASFWAQSAEEQRNTLTHELVHLLLCRVDQMSDALEETLGSAGWSLWRPLYENEHERAVDAVALLLSPHLPTFPIESVQPKAKR